MSRPCTTVPRDDVSEHPAFRAWAALGTDAGSPDRIDVLRVKKKSGVYRLVGAGPGRCGVVAKRSSSESLQVERTVYAEILPRLGVPALRCFGFAQEPGGEQSWIFVEDGGGNESRPDPRRDAETLAAGLALLHGEASRIHDETGLPDRGAAHYREHLRIARDTILRSLASSSLRNGEAELLRNIVGQCDLLASLWTGIEDACDGFPRTLVHGDVAEKHMRVHRTTAGSALLLFDWETAGWGVPAVDLAQLEVGRLWGVQIHRYHAAVRRHWPRADFGRIGRLASAGSVFRLLALLCWESSRISDEPSQKTMSRMAVYHAEMARVLAGFESEESFRLRDVGAASP
jgi:hypothetical protein